MSDGSYRGTVVTVTDISQLRQQADELRRSIDTLRQVDAERRQLVRHLVQAGEEERQRIAEDLHDDTIQAVTVVGLRLGLLRRRFPVLDGDEQYRQLEQAVTDAVARCRSMLFDLHPRALDTEGIGAALAGYLKNVAVAGGPVCELEDELVIEPDSAERVILFRITQEALVNVRKHAHAAHARIKLWNQDHGFAVSVKDDGVGFEPGTSGSGHGHLGLTTMQERASQAQGWLRVESTPGKGTDIQFWIPESIDVDAA
jgi:signal transduction histidine kinase